MHNTPNAQSDGLARESEEARRARAEVKQEFTRQAAQRRAEARAEYDSEGEERRAKSDKLRALRKLREARERVASAAS